jgi:hypothetical protein
MVKIYVTYVYALKKWYARLETSLDWGIRYGYKPSEAEIKKDFDREDAIIIWQS